VGAGANPAVALILIVLFLTIVRFGGETLKEAIMKKKHSDNVRAIRFSVARTAISQFADTIWTIGSGAAAELIVPTLTH
jgi:hypothetical protein